MVMSMLLHVVDVDDVVHDVIDADVDPSLFSKLCPFLHAEVMYGDTPLDISCFTTFISVQQYLTLCPPLSLD